MANGKLSLPVATLTKTKLNIQQTALVGIAAVATAALLGAFTAQFASAIAGVRIAATTISCTNPANLACGKPVTSVAPPTSYWQKAYTPERVTDGNRTTYSTTSDWKMGYEINLKQSTEVAKLVITWGRWGFSPYTDGKRYMNDYYVYGLSSGTWTKLAGKASAPNENTTTITLTTPVKIEKLRVTSGWGLQADGRWGIKGFNKAGNPLGLFEVEAYGSIVFDRRGSLVSLACPPAGPSITDPCNDVYYIGFDNNRYIFRRVVLGAETYWDGPFTSWYPGASIAAITPTEMSQYKISGNVLIRPGTWLVKIATDSKVYAVGADRKSLRLVATDSSSKLAAALYGTDWQSPVRVATIPDLIFPLFTMGADWVALNKHLDGTLIRYASSTDVYLIDFGKKRLVTDSGFSTNRYDLDSIVRNVDPRIFIYPNGAAVTGYEPRLSTPSGPIPNAPAEGYCGDGTANSVQEDCDGSDGVTQGYLCTDQCRLRPSVPVYGNGVP